MKLGNLVMDQWIEGDGDGTMLSLIGRLVSEEVDSPTLGQARTDYAYEGPGGLLSEMQQRIRDEWFTTHVDYYAGLADSARARPLADARERRAQSGHFRRIRSGR